MDELIRLSRIVTNSYSLATVFPCEGNSKSKEGILLSNISRGKFKTDEEAAHTLYGTNSNDVKYKMLKHRLKKKLYNKLLFLDYNKIKSNPYRFKEHECMKLLHHAQILFRQYELDLVTSAARKVLAIAEEFDFTGYKLTALELLSACLSEQGELRKFNRNQEELKRTLKIRELEREAILTYQDVKLNLNKSVKSRRLFFPSLPSTIRRLEEIWNLAGTFDSFDSYYKVYIWYNELTGDFHKIAQITLQVEEWYRKGSINKNRFELGYNKYILVYALFRAKDYEKGLLYAEQYVSSFNRRSSNWFAFMENYFLLAMHARKYELALNLIHQVYDNSAFSKISNAAKERWMLFRSYHGLLDYSPELHKNANAIFSALPEYSKDKQGFNVAILVYQFVLFLKKGDIETLIYRIESLKKYILTHLKDSFSLRSKLFLKLLMLTVTENFDADNCIEKGNVLHQKLLNTPTPGDAFAEIEIVPYEHLWDHILETLKSKSFEKMR